MLDLGELELYAPHGVAELADGTLLISSPASGAFGLLATNASAVRALRVSPSNGWLATHDRAALARRVGERDFYEATRSGISCQSCHMHADSDEAAYNLGDHRLLPTLSVRGVAGTAPYLRDGSYPRLRDLEDVAQTLYRGYLRNQAARGEALEAFVGSLARRDSPRARDIAAERRGFAAFNKAACSSCHTPPAFTDLAQIPLRSLFPEQAATLAQEETLDVPSLLSVGASAPYLNDGRAATLEAVLVEHNRRNLHGDVRALSASERRDLLAFLGSL
jgi:cytochrome c peroxidase